MLQNAISRTRYALATLGLLVVSAAFLPTLAQTTSISGVVTDKHGAVIPGVNISATNKDTGQTSPPVTTDSEGRYAIPNLPPGHYEVRATLPGFAVLRVEATIGLGRTSAVNITFDDSQPVHGAIQISTPRPGTIKGTVKTESNGRPIRNAEIRIQDQGALQPQFMVRTNGSGRFSKSHLPPGTYKISVKASGFQDGEQNVELAERQVKAIAFTLHTP